MDILELASEDFPLKKVGSSVWAVDSDGEFSSIRIWPGTNTWHRFSNGTGGSIRQWLYYIRHYSGKEIDEVCGKEVKKSSLMEFMGRRTVRSNAPSVSYEKIIGAKVYNEYIASRGISKETAQRFSIEVQGDNALFPLLEHDGKRIGALVRYANAKQDSDRYRVYTIENHPKPYFWPMPLLRSLRDERDILVIVESTWSTCLLAQNIGTLYPNLKIGCVIGKSVSEELIQSISKVPCVFILDDDSGGDFMQAQVLSYMLKYKLKAEIYRPDVYIDEMSDEEHKELFDYITKHTKFNVEVCGDI